jgi:hypothetical protein
MYSAVIGAPHSPSQAERLPRNPSWRRWPRIARNSNSTVIAECTGKADSDRRRSSWSAATRVQRLSTSRFSPRPSSTGHPHPRRGTERMNLSPIARTTGHNVFRAAREVLNQCHTRLIGLIVWRRWHPDSQIEDRWIEHQLASASDDRCQQSRNLSPSTIVLLSNYLRVDPCAGIRQ